MNTTFTQLEQMKHGLAFSQILVNRVCLIVETILSVTENISYSILNLTKAIFSLYRIV